MAALSAHVVPFDLVERITGDSGIFGAAAAGQSYPPVTFHWRASLAGLPAYGWIAMFTSIVVVSNGPADWTAFAGVSPSYLPRIYQLDGATTSVYLAPISTEVAAPAFDDTDGPWRLTTDATLSQGSAVYYLTEALRGGQENLGNFQWREPNWLCNIDLPGGSTGSGISVQSVDLPYFTSPPAQVDYFFGADGYWSPDVPAGAINQFPAAWQTLDARLIVLGCGPVSPPAITAGVPAVGVVNRDIRRTL